jgi:hypothetical protein
MTTLPDLSRTKAAIEDYDLADEAYRRLVLESDEIDVHLEQELWDGLWDWEEQEA